jgi:ACS family hexuronate transporter-like MFS transporter
MSDTPARQKFFPKLVLLLLFAGSMINYLHRSVLSVVIPQVRRDLGLTNANYGLVIHAFLVMYAVFYILGGRIADRLGYRRTFTLTLFIWSLAAIAHTFVQGVRSLFFCQALLGVGEGSYYPTAMRGAAGLFPSASRAKAVGTILSAISLGMLLGPPLVAWTTLRYGWRNAFLLLGSLGLLLLVPWEWVHRKFLGAGITAADPAQAREDDSHPAAFVEHEMSLGEVLKTRKYWCVLAARACADSAWYFYLFWIPGYFQEVRGLSLGGVGRVLWVPYFCSFVGAHFGAAASSALVRRGLGLHRSRKTVLLGSAALCVFSASAGFAPDTMWALALVSLALFAHQSYSTNIHTVITEISPPRHVAILYGMTGAAGTLIGAAAQLVIGHVVDLHGYKPAFVAAGGMYVVAAGFLLSAGVLEPMRRKLAEAPAFGPGARG